MEAADGGPLWDPRRRMTALWQEQEEEGGWSEALRRQARRRRSTWRPAMLEVEAARSWGTVEAGSGAERWRWARRE